MIFPFSYQSAVLKVSSHPFRHFVLSLMAFGHVKLLREMVIIGLHNFINRTRTFYRPVQQFICMIHINDPNSRHHRSPVHQRKPFSYFNFNCLKLFYFKYLRRRPSFSFIKNFAFTDQYQRQMCQLD